MYETLKMMESIIIGKEKETKEEDLIREYQISKAPNILAFMYVNNFGYMIKLSENNYPIIDMQSKASFCLQELDKCLLNYKFTEGASFLTYFSRCYKNRLKTEAYILNLNKNKANFVTAELLEETINVNSDIEDIDLILLNYNLTANEKEVCKFLNDGYKVKDIANKLNSSLTYIYSIVNNIKKKLAENI